MCLTSMVGYLCSNTYLWTNYEFYPKINICMNLDSHWFITWRQKNELYNKKIF
ncbi:hypothetical protein WALBB_1060034 [Wolbachia pipientis wAlbB]|nr:hypothetical protein WALBB_1060034 [Wolbachia pipientis wAlbB]